jgi:hypothetical protein
MHLFLRTSRGLHFVTTEDGAFVASFRQYGAFARALCARRLGCDVGDLCFHIL